MDETADSGESQVGSTEESTEESGIDMGSAMDSISSDLFNVKPEEAEEVTEEVEVEATDEPEEVEEPVEEPKEEVAAKPAPQSWKKDMHDLWEGLNPDVQDYIEQRELEMREGLEMDRGDANLGRSIRDAVAPYSEMLQNQGIDEGAMVRNLMNAHYRLSTADDAGRKDLIQQLAQSYGVPLDGEVDNKVDPTIQAMNERLRGLEAHLSASQQQARQEAQSRIEKDVEEFASDPEHEFFDEVSEQIIPLINAGYELEDAYQSAIWLNPVTRQKEIDRAAKEAADKAQNEAKKEVEKAKKAKSINVRGRDTNRAPQEPIGTMEDTMRETYRSIINQ